MCSDKDYERLWDENKKLKEKIDQLEEDIMELEFLLKDATNLFALEIYNEWVNKIG